MTNPADEIAALRARIRAIHYPHVVTVGAGPDKGAKTEQCVACEMTVDGWPCPTIEALEHPWPVVVTDGLTTWRQQCWCLNRDDGHRHDFTPGRGVGLCGERPTGLSARTDLSNRPGTPSEDAS
jgi:hypothetical protein